MSPLLTGAANFMEFQIDGFLPEENQLSFIHDRIKQFSFQDIDDTYDEYSIGWVSVLDMFDNTFAFASDMNGDFVTISFRVDERSVPGAVLKKYVEKECRREMTEKQIPRLSRSMKVQIRERIRTEFMRKAKPSPTVVNLAWDLAGNRVWFFSTNKKVQALLEDFFWETFGLRLRQNVPYVAAESIIPDVTALEAITECSFV